jgi:hypothetical protein
MEIPMVIIPNHAPATNFPNYCLQIRYLQAQAQITSRWYYGKPRMTRDLDFIAALLERHVDVLVSAFSSDFYIDEDAVQPSATNS